MFSHIFSSNYSRFTPVVFFEAEGAIAGGGNPPSDDKPSNPTKAEIESVVQKTVQDVLNSQRVSGDTSAALNVLAAKALKEEQRAKTAEAKLGTIPDDVKAKLDAFEALGTVEELTKRLEATKALEAEKVQRDRTDVFRKAAAIAGYDADALMEVIGEVPESVLETVNQNGKEITVAKVKVTADGKEETKVFDAFIQGRFAKTHESFKANPKPQVTLPVMGINGGADQPRPVVKPAGYRM